MKINHFNRVGMNPYNKQLEKMDKAANIVKKDKVEISTEAMEMQKGNAMEIERQKRVEELKNKIDAGEYKVEPEKIAQKMYNYWTEIR